MGFRISSENVEFALVVGKGNIVFGQFIGHLDHVICAVVGDTDSSRYTGIDAFRKIFGDLCY